MGCIGTVTQFGDNDIVFIYLHENLFLLKTKVSIFDVSK